MTTRPDVSVLDAEQHAARALAILEQVICPETGRPVDLSLGYCEDRHTHPHCPYCGSTDECTHLLAQWCDDFGYSGPDIPLVPEEWSASTDWTELQLRDTLGDLQPAFARYVEHQDQYDLALELAVLLNLKFQLVSWCSDGRPASIGNVCYATAGLAAVEQLAAAGARAAAAVTRLSALRNPGVPGTSEDVHQ